MPDVFVLAYHAVSDRWPAALASTPAQLEHQVTKLVKRGYRPSTFTDVVLDPPSRRTFVVTFDDAYSSVVKMAFPILEQVGVSATVFAPTAYIGSAAPLSWPGIDHWVGTEYEDELTAASWDELGQLVEAGWEVGSHTHTHPRLPMLSDQDLAAEMETSITECVSHLGVPCRSLAYPYGAHDDRVVEAAAHAGFVAAATLPDRLTRPAPLRFPRIGIYRKDDPWRFHVKVSPTVRRIRASRAWPLVKVGGG